MICSLTNKFYNRFFDPYNSNSFAGRSRSKRWSLFCGHFPELSEMTVLDLGGVPAAWDDCPIKPKMITIVNLNDFSEEVRPNFRFVQGDAVELPGRVSNEYFDLVYSNSLIEHVGGFERRKKLAKTVASSGAHFWIQAPYRYFPIEPHWLFPFFQFLPLNLKAKVSRRWNLGGYTSVKSPDSAVELVLEVELPSITDFRYLFPGSKIIVEHFAGLPKSIIAKG